MFFKKIEDVEYATTVSIFITRGGWLMFGKYTHDVTFSPTMAMFPTADVCVSTFY